MVTCHYFSYTHGLGLIMLKSTNISVIAIFEEIRLFICTKTYYLLVGRV